MATQHGGIWNQNLWPQTPADGSWQTFDYAGRTCEHGRIGFESLNGNNIVSPMLSAAETTLTPALIAKMNVLRGIDVPWYLGHHTGGYLGNYARNDGNGTPLVTTPHPTLDQILAWSDNFYSDLTGVLKRSMVMGRNRMSYMWASPADRTGDIQRIEPENSSLDLFNQIFVPPDDGSDPRTPVVDRVVENYRRLRNTNRRLSARDRQRLDDHMERVFELQRRLNTFTECTDVMVPTQDSLRDVRRADGFGHSPDMNRQAWQLMNDVIAVAFSCGSSRIVSMNVADNFSTFQGDWHQDVAHQADSNASRQETILNAHQRFFEDVFMDLATKLEAIQDGEGVSVLDNTLIQWQHESGPKTHDAINLPIITIGSAGGFFNTGNFVDFGNKGIDKDRDSPETNRHPGIFHNQWLGTVARAMGLERSEYDLQGHGGFGYLEIHRENNWFGRSDWWPESLRALTSENIPIIS
jgi:hypothetical protein